MREGALFAILYVVVMALSVVWVGRLHHIFSTPVMLLVVSFSAIVFYSLGSINQLKQSYLSIIRFPWLWLCMSLSFALTWWLMYFTTVTASPRAAIVVFYLVVACLGCLLDRQFFAAVLCAFSLILSIFLLHEFSPVTVFSGTCCGLFGYIYMHASGKYAKVANLSASQVLSIRFLLLFVGSLIGVIFSSKALPDAANIHHISVIFALLLLIIFNLLPNYCAQKSIMVSGTNRFSQIIAYTPAATFLVQGFFYRTWDWRILILCLAISILLNYLVLIKIKA